MARSSKPTQTQFAEIGAAGLRRTGGYISADFLPQLVGQEAVRRYTEMAQNDPLIGAILFAISMLLRNSTWRVDPKDEKNAEAKERAEWLKAELFDKMETPFADVISEVSSMFTYGFAPMEPVFIKRDDGTIGVRKIELRNQETLDKWQYDDADREVIGMWQTDFTHPRVLIPIERLLLFRTQTANANPEGRSVLRTSYVAWMRKKAIEEAEGRAAMRAAGIVVVRIPGAYMMTSASADEKAVYQAYTAMAGKLAQDRQGAAVLPSDIHPDTKERLYDIEYVVADGRRSADMSPIIERVDKRIASTVLADFILLGQQAVGSFALSSDKTALFSVALGAWLSVIAGVFNRQLIPRLAKYNGWDPELMPKLVPEDVETPNLGELGLYIANLSKAGMPLFPDEKLGNHLRQIAGLPEASEEAIAAQRQAAENDQLMAEAQRQQAEADAKNAATPPKTGAANA